MVLVQALGHTAYPGGNIFFRSIVNTQKEGGVCKGGMYVKRSHMGMFFNCGRPMSTSASRSITLLAGSCSLYELNVGALCCSEHSLLLSSSSVCHRARKCARSCGHTCDAFNATGMEGG